MIFELSETEQDLLLSLKEGFSKILIYKIGLYPSAVSFVLASNKTVTVRARQEDVAEGFEVFPLDVSDLVIGREPEEAICIDDANKPLSLSILQKSEWDIPSCGTEKEHMIGNPDSATTQYEGKFSDIPQDAINSATLHAGLRVDYADGKSFSVASSMFPHALYVSDCDFSETIDSTVYDFIEIVA